MIYLASLTERIEDKVQGYYLIKTKAELDKIVVDNSKSNRVIIRSDFASEYFTPSGLNKYVSEVRRLNSNIIIELEDTEVLTEENFLKKVQSTETLEELMFIVSKYPKEYFDTVKKLADSAIEDRRELLAASSSVSRLQNINDDLRRTVAELEDALKTEQINKNLYASQLDSLVNKINYQYNIPVDKNKIFEIDTNSYEKVLYIKELTRVQYVDSLIYYLKEILNVLFEVPARLVVIESYYGTSKPSLYPDLIPHYSLKEKDVLSGDILMLGLQPKLMKDILHNPRKISTLIVLDRAGYVTPHIKGTNVEVLYTASDCNDVPVVVPKSRIISYSEDTLFIPFVKDFEKKDKNEKMAKYSSMSIVKKIISLLKG